MIGRTYHRRYGYPWRIAVPAEVAWRIEHLPFNYEGQVFAPLARWGYRQRKRLERAGAEIARTNQER